MIQCGSGLCFMNESSPFLVVSQGMWGEKFKRDFAPELGVFGLVDDAHAAFTELLEDLVVGDGLADHFS